MGGGMDAMMKEMMQGMGGGGGGGSFSSFSSSFSMGGGAESSRTETVVENGRRVTKTIRCVRGGNLGPALATVYLCVPECCGQTAAPTTSHGTRATGRALTGTHTRPLRRPKAGAYASDRG
jgi:hypothetical protein